MTSFDTFGCGVGKMLDAGRPPPARGAPRAPCERKVASKASAAPHRGAAGAASDVDGEQSPEARREPGAAGQLFRHGFGRHRRDASLAGNLLDCLSAR